MINDVQIATSPSGSQVSQGAQTTGISSDFNTFLTMLTAQIQNQDPLNPMDSSQYAVQLATFSGVEQQVQTNDLLRDLVGGGMSQIADYAGWVGMRARTDAPVQFNGTPVDVQFNLPAGIDTAELVVATQAGHELHRFAISKDASSLSWDGISPTGATLLEGSYKLSVETRSGGADPQVTPVTSYATVREVRTGPSGAEVVLDNGLSVSANTVQALRQP